MLDAMEDEEGPFKRFNIPYVNEYIRTIVVPAVDTYRFGKLAAGAGTIVYSQTVAVADVSDKFQLLFKIRRKTNSLTEGNILHTPAVDTILQTLLTAKYIQVGAFNGNMTLNK